MSKINNHEIKSVSVKVDIKKQVFEFYEKFAGFAKLDVGRVLNHAIESYLYGILGTFDSNDPYFAPEKLRKAYGLGK